MGAEHVGTDLLGIMDGLPVEPLLEYNGRARQIQGQRGRDQEFVRVKQALTGTPDDTCGHGDEDGSKGERSHGLVA